jgi:hypothetical protein
LKSPIASAGESPPLVNARLGKAALAQTEGGEAEAGEQAAGEVGIGDEGHDGAATAAGAPTSTSAGELRDVAGVAIAGVAVFRGFVVPSER